MKLYETIICVPDLHEPFSHPEAYDFLSLVKKTYWTKNSTKVINLGDECDYHSLSRWPKDPEGYSAGHEHQVVIESLKQLWDLFPEQDICTSNHTMRPLRKAFDSGLPKAFLREVKEFLLAPPGIRWADTWEYNGIHFEHGEGVSGNTAALKAAIQNQIPTVIGHQHTFGGVIWAANERTTLWGGNAGCLIDTNAYAFQYAKTLRNKPTLGCIVIADCVPTFLPMRTIHGRWIGKL